MDWKLRRWELALMLGAALALVLGAWLGGEQRSLAGRVVRLHVIANSDSDFDQALKLQVRDAILDEAASLLEPEATLEETEAVLAAHLRELAAAGASVVSAEGCSYPVAASLERTWFPTKEYDGFTLPAGEYLALRVLIGEAKGQNWWCVVFPPLCTTASVEVPASALEAGLSEEEVRLITEENTGYVLKFKAVEWWQQAKQMWSEWT